MSTEYRNIYTSVSVRLSFGTCFVHFSSELSAKRSIKFFTHNFLSIGAVIMGNFLQSFTSSAVDDEVKTPPMASLTKEEVRIIQETWKIPSANVSAETCNKTDKV